MSCNGPNTTALEALRYTGHPDEKSWTEDGLRLDEQQVATRSHE